MAKVEKVKTVMKRDVKRKLGPAGKKNQEYVHNLNETIGLYFSPQNEEKRKEKKKCTMCGKELVSDSYWKNFSYINTGRIDEDNKMCCPVCKTCGQKLFDYYYKMVHHKSYVKSMEHVCCDLNIYWDIDIFNDCKQVFENNGRKLHILSEYVGALGRRGVEYLGKTYWESPTIQNRNITILQGENVDFEKKLINPEDQKISKDGWDTPLDWDKEDAENRKKVIKIYRYDPFEFEPEEDKPGLYRDLVAMLDDAMEDDYVKSRGALEVVRSFNRIEKLGNTITAMEKAEEDLSKIQKVVEFKAKERASVTAFCKDNGFAASYGTKKAKGAGTLSGIMNEMNEKQYERGILNRFDIATSQSIQQAADASVKAIFEQLNIGGNETYTIIQNQNDAIRTLEKKLRETEEELRRANCKIVEMKLKYKQKSPDDNEEVDVDD